MREKAYLKDRCGRRELRSVESRRRGPRRNARGERGQSFVELSLTLLVLMLLVAGIAEYGQLLNRYLNLLDAAREAARYNANFNPFCPATSTDPLCPPGAVIPDYYAATACEAKNVLLPIHLDAARGDDIVISFFTVSGAAISGRYPLTEGENGWSWSAHGGWSDESHCLLGAGGTRNHVSRQSSGFILSRMDPTAPDVSVTLVELFYNYPQTLKMPFFMLFVPDPIPVYTYAVMPIKNVTPPTP
jgi:hypothetical protein